MPAPKLAEEIKRIIRKRYHHYHPSYQPILSKFLSITEGYKDPEQEDWRDTWMQVIEWGKENGLLTSNEYGALAMLMK